MVLPLIIADNPTTPVAGNQHWGHATSTDLYNWVNQPIALFATEDSQIFSGSIVIDVNNTSGFFPNQTNGVIAMVGPSSLFNLRGFL